MHIGKSKQIVCSGRLSIMLTPGTPGTGIDEDKKMWRKFFNPCWEISQVAKLTPKVL